MTTPFGARPGAARRPEPERPLRVLLVCQANVCRSRAAEVLLRDLAATAGVRVSARSAGTRVHPHAPRCEVMDGLFAARGVEVFADRPPRMLDAELLLRSDLVLVAEARHRAVAARMLPAARTRTFTLVEAAALAGAISSGSLGAAAPAGADDPRSVVEQLHAARGQVDLTPRRRAGLLPWRRSSTDPEHPLDLPDVHTRGRRPHDRTLALLTQSLSPVVDLLATRPAGSA